MAQWDNLKLKRSLLFIAFDHCSAKIPFFLDLSLPEQYKDEIGVAGGLEINDL